MAQARVRSCLGFAFSRLPDELVNRFFAKAHSSGDWLLDEGPTIVSSPERVLKGIESWTGARRMSPVRVVGSVATALLAISPA
jgi:hypothetical protein